MSHPRLHPRQGPHGWGSGGTGLPPPSPSQAWWQDFTVGPLQLLLSCSWGWVLMEPHYLTLGPGGMLATLPLQPHSRDGDPATCPAGGIFSPIIKCVQGAYERLTAAGSETGFRARACDPPDPPGSPGQVRDLGHPGPGPLMAPRPVPTQLVRGSVATEIREERGMGGAPLGGLRPQKAASGLRFAVVWSL